MQYEVRFTEEEIKQLAKDIGDHLSMWAIHKANQPVHNTGAQIITDSVIIDFIEANREYIKLPDFSRYRGQWVFEPWEDAKTFETFREAMMSMPVQGIGSSQGLGSSQPSPAPLPGVQQPSPSQAPPPVDQNQPVTGSPAAVQNEAMLDKDTLRTLRGMSDDYVVMVWPGENEERQRERYHMQANITNFLGWVGEKLEEAEQAKKRTPICSACSTTARHKFVVFCDCCGKKFEVSDFIEGRS